MDAVQCFHALHHRPQFRLRQRVHRRIELAVGHEEIVRIVRCLLKPALEYQSGVRDEVDALLHGVAALAAVQKGIDQGSIGGQVPSLFQIVLNRMVGRHQSDGFLDHRHRNVVLAQTQVAENRIQQIDADAAVLAVQHRRDHAIGAQATGQRLHSGQRICHVVQDAAGYHEIEVTPQRVQVFDWQQMQLEVGQPVLVFQILLMIQ